MYIRDLGDLVAEQVLRMDQMDGIDSGMIWDVLSISAHDFQSNGGRLMTKNWSGVQLQIKEVTWLQFECDLDYWTSDDALFIVEAIKI